MQAAHQAEMTRALVATAVSRPDGEVRPDPSDWNAYCDNTNPEAVPILFILQHRFNNSGAMLPFSNFRCTVTDPAGVTTVATGRHITRMGVGLVAEYAQHSFAGAPPARNGDYTFIWDGQDAKGTWREIARNRHDVTGRPGR